MIMIVLRNDGSDAEECKIIDTTDDDDDIYDTPCDDFEPNNKEEIYHSLLAI